MPLTFNLSATISLHSKEWLFMVFKFSRAARKMSDGGLLVLPPGGNSEHFTKLTFLFSATLRERTRSSFALEIASMK